MRTLWICALALALLAAPAFGQAAKRPRRECVKLSQQIARYADDVERARQRDNELWEKATLDHIDRLAARRGELCPEYAQDDTMKRVAELLGAAAKLAAKYFTMGAL